MTTELYLTWKYIGRVVGWPPLHLPNFKLNVSHPTGAFAIYLNGHIASIWCATVAYVSDVVIPPIVACAPIGSRC